MEYKPELNFLTEFELSEDGMISEIKTEFNIIRLALSQIDELGKDYINMLDRIIVMPLRKLLCEKNSVLRKICPNFKMPPIDGVNFNIDNSRLHVQLAPYKISDFHTWICIDKWLKQKIAYFDKDFNDIPQIIEKQTFKNIFNKLNKTEKNDFSNFFENGANINAEHANFYVLKDSLDVNEKKYIFELMNNAGYYSLTVYRFIKHLSDKRGAHIDLEIDPLITIINRGINATPIQCIAIQLIYAAKKQISKLETYWHDMPDFYELGM